MQAVVAAVLAILAARPLHHGGRLPLRPLLAHIVAPILPRTVHPLPPLQPNALLLLLTRTVERPQEPGAVLLLRVRDVQLLEILALPCARPFALTGPAAGHDEPAHFQAGLGSVERDQLRHEAAHAEAEDVDLGEAECERHGDHVRRPPGVLLRHLPAGFADARVVKQEHGPVRGERVDQQRVPVVEGAAEVDVQD